MLHPTLIAEFKTLALARLGLEVLSENKYDMNLVALVARSDAPELAEISKAGEAEENPKPATVKPSSASTIGAILGGAMATPLAFGTLMLPFIVVVPIAGAAAGAVVASTLGDSKSGKIDPSVREAYEKRLNEGGGLLIVTGSNDELVLEKAERMLQTVGPVSMRRIIPDHLESHPGKLSSVT